VNTTFAARVGSARRAGVRRGLAADRGAAARVAPVRRRASSRPAVAAHPGTLRGRVAHAVEGFTPGYFALVMATGILSVGLRLRGLDAASAVLLVLAACAYVVQVALSLWRFAAYRHAVVDDFTDPGRAFGFLTFVAGTNVLAARLAMEGYVALTAVLVGVGALTWLVLGYVVPWTAVLSRAERPVVATANGTWFIWVVASQSVAVGTATLERDVASSRYLLAVVAVVAWSVGMFLYSAAGIFVAARMLLYPLRAADLTPPYWVAMGASAITVLAGARIIEMADTPMVTVMRGLAAGVSVVFWAFATWLIPVLVAAGWWRHRVHRVPLRYEATLWSIVFPLGMYSVAGTYLGQADGLPLVGAIGGAFLWVALGAWAVVGVAMVRHLVVTVLRPTPDGAPPAA